MKYLDRIAEGYEGLLGETSQKKSQRRINWICDQVKGNTVLDVGCSQGICELLLGRQGFHVTGIDVAEESIEYARKMVDKEPFHVKQRIQFFCADFLKDVQLTETYDTLLLTEILEHLEKPEEMIAKAVEVLADDGLLIVTVPFGINDFPDHKQTFYMADIVAILSKYVSIEHTEFMEGWIGFLGRKTATPIAAATYDSALIRREEENFYVLERGVRDRVKALSEHKVAQKELQDKLQKNLETLQNKLMQMQEELEKAAEELQEEAAAKQVLENALRTANDKRKKANDKCVKQEKEIEKLNRKLTILANQYTALQNSFWGRVQLRIWSLKNKLLYQADDNPGAFRNFLKKIPGLRRFVFFLRGDQCYREYGNVKKKSLPAKQTEKQSAEAKVKEKGLVAAKPVPAENNQAVKTEFGPADKDLYYHGRTDEGYFDRIAPMLEEIADSNGSRYYEKSKLKIGCVMDEFQYHTYHDVAEVIYLKPDDYKYDIDILMIVSPWRGIDLAWQGVGNPKNEMRRTQMLDLIRYYKQRGIKTVFYSKEDPGNYLVFVDFAKECDYIFTSETDSITDYQRDTGNQNVFHLPFGINPLYHNPIGSQKYHLPEVVFSGTWWGYKYPERIEDQYLMMDGVLSAGKTLRLIDRNYHSGKMSAAFPEKYLSAVAPSIDHENLQKVHKLYNWSINLNTAKYSSTMFASRVFELQALGCNIISNYSKGMLGYFSDIPYATTQEEVRKILTAATDASEYESSMAGIRRAMSHETVYHRFDYILRSIGEAPVDRTRRVLVLAENPKDQKIREMFDCQSYEAKTLMPAAQATDELVKEYDCYTFFHADYQYGEQYLEDMINAFKYTDSDFITKNAFDVNGEIHTGMEHDYVDVFHDRCKTVFWNNIPLSAVKEDSLGWNGYSADHLNLSVSK